ncbi:MAG: hypothetical protein RL033_600 [Pseudomonadota bacterium]|jgi:hypothetical protein
MSETSSRVVGSLIAALTSFSAVLVPFCAVSLACGEEERVVREDEGSVCLSQSEGELQVVVPFQYCLSATCDLHRQSECSLSLEADGIHVHSRLSYVQMSGSCSPDCGLLAAVCSMPLPADGTYLVVLGDQGGEITLPLSETTTNAFPAEAQPGGNPCALVTALSPQD